MNLDVKEKERIICILNEGKNLVKKKEQSYAFHQNT